MTDEEIFPEAERQAFLQGQRAARAGKSLDHNPYLQTWCTPRAWRCGQSWADGWEHETSKEQEETSDE